VLPNVRLRRRQPAVETRDPDLLFFADFARLDHEDFERRLAAALRDDHAIYRLLIRNLHNQGRYLLGQKYRYIRYSYFAFVAAIVAGALAELVRLA
jgi:hypothetical protein